MATTQSVETLNREATCEVQCGTNPRASHPPKAVERACASPKWFQQGATPQAAEPEGNAAAQTRDTYT